MTHNIDQVILGDNQFFGVNHMSQDRGHETYEQFEADKICCHAVTYNIQCIGESVYKMSQEFKESHPDTEWHLISGMRHVLVHDYYQVSFKFIWNVIKHDLTLLREQIEKYLANM